MSMLLAVDGHSLMYRAFYALPLLSDAGGHYTNAVMGTFSMLLRAIDELAPTHLAFCFDMHAKTQRAEKYEAYKAQRKPMPPEMRDQIPMMHDILRELGVPVFEREGIEADDLLGSLAALAEAEGMETVILTGDRDSFQLLRPGVDVLLTKKGISESVRYDTEQLLTDYGIRPEQVPSLKGLMGDASDNIPGVPGVGEKTALKLVCEYGDIAGVYAHIDEIKGKLKEKLTEGRELAELSLDLATIDSGALNSADFDAMRLSGGWRGAWAGALYTRGFSSLSKRLSEGETVPAVSAGEVKKLTSAAEVKKLAALIKETGSMQIVYGDTPTFGVGGVTYEPECELNLLGMGFTYESVAEELAEVLSDAGIDKLVYNKKAFMTWLSGLDITLAGAEHDVMIADYVADPIARGYDYAAVCARFGLPPQAGALPELYARLTAKIDELSLSRIFYDIETPLTDVLFAMERCGFCVDAQALAEIGAGITAAAEREAAAVCELAGHEFNVNSTQQLGVVLFEELGLPSGKKTKKGYSTGSDVLESLDHPIAAHVLAYRSYAKLKSTYIDGLAEQIGADGRIHTTFKQESTVTGRISSMEPNLQNIPTRTEYGREIRKVFRASDADHILICADYSQIELRILAHLSGDAAMTAAFTGGEDIHTATAATVFGVAPGEVTQAQRRQAKAVNFGIVYGISEFGLSRNLGIPHYRAKELIDRYLAQFPGVAAYMERTIAAAKEDRYVSTMWGRRRELPELHSKDYNTRAFGERAARNTPVQGTAADIIKKAMIDVHTALTGGGYGSRLILQVHDELIVDALRSEKGAVTAILTECMEGAAQLDVPLTVNVSSGETWYEAK